MLGIRLLLVVVGVIVVENARLELLLDGHGYPVNHSGLMRTMAPASELPGGLACFVENVLK